MLRTTALLAALALAGAAHAQTPPHGAHPETQAGSKTVDIQGPQGAFADKSVMMPFFNILLEAHNQGDKADLPAMESKIRAMIPAAFNSGKPVSKAMEDHVLGVAHQALALGVSNPKLFDSYEVFMATMVGPK
jgi:hypothetical protein